MKKLLALLVAIVMIVSATFLVGCGDTTKGIKEVKSILRGQGGQFVIENLEQSDYEKVDVRLEFNKKDIFFEASVNGEQKMLTIIVYADGEEVFMTYSDSQKNSYVTAMFEADGELEFMDVYKEESVGRPVRIDQTNESYQQFYDDARLAFKAGAGWFNSTLYQATNGKYTSITQLLDR